jgi:cation:H+ antiporter
MLLPIILLLTGFVLLLKGADFLIKGASSVARRFNVSEMIIGLTIVAFGTSTPELVVNMVASSEGHIDVVLGNIIGSNNFNLFIILGISAMIYPLVIHRSMVLKEIPFSLVAALMVLLLANDNLLFNGRKDMLGRVDGFILLGFFGVFLLYMFRNIKEEKKNNPHPHELQPLARSLIMLVAGFTGLIIGGKLSVDNAVKIAQMLDISERIIGLTVVAAGTSLPELATSAVAAYHKKSDIAVANIVGSNIFNIFLILGLSLLISPAQYQHTFNIDLSLLIAGTIFLLFFTYTGRKAMVDRWEAVILLLSFTGYTLFLIAV